MTSKGRHHAHLPLVSHRSRLLFLLSPAVDDGHWRCHLVRSNYISGAEILGTLEKQERAVSTTLSKRKCLDVNAVVSFQKASNTGQVCIVNLHLQKQQADDAESKERFQSSLAEALSIAFSRDSLSVASGVTRESRS